MSAAIVIVGGGPAGHSCAKTYRERGGRERVLVLGQDRDRPYQRPPLSKEFLRGEIDRGKLPMEDEGFYAARGIELRTGVRVASIDTATHQLQTDEGESIGFGTCVLATGSRPARPDVPGLELPGVLTLRSIADSERLRERAGQGRQVVVIGSGFIGCEAAISAASRGAEVTLATNEARPQEARLGGEVADRIAGWLSEAGIELVTGVELCSIEERSGGSGLRVRLSDRELEADTVVAALGVSRNTEPAAAAGIELSEELIPTDERMRTEVEDMLAIGDIALAHNAAAGRRLPVEHWGEALRHGEVAGAVLAGDDERWENAPGFWSGLGERTIKQVAWGDGFDRVELTEHSGEAFTARYHRGGELVGVLTHEADDDYERGREQVEAGGS